MAHLAHLWIGDKRRVMIVTEQETPEELQARYPEIEVDAWVELDDDINWEAWPADFFLAALGLD